MNQSMEYDKQLKEEILALVESRPMNYGQCCTSSTFSDIGIKIYNATPLLSSDDCGKLVFVKIYNCIL